MAVVFFAVSVVGAVAVDLVAAALPEVAAEEVVFFEVDSLAARAAAAFLQQIN